MCRILRWPQSFPTRRWCPPLQRRSHLLYREVEAGSGSNPVHKDRVASRVQTHGPFALCPSDPAKPLVEPEALQSIHARTSNGTPYAQQLATGAGVKVAFIADGMDPNAPDFIRPDGSHVFVDYQDFSGAGPSATYAGLESYGDASAIAAQGTVVHDLSDFVNQAHPLPHGCNIRVVGVAPGASLVGLTFDRRLLDPAGDRLRRHHRPRRCPQRVVRPEHLPGHEHEGHRRAVQ